MTLLIPPTPRALSTAVTELSLAIGKLRRKLRTETNPDELNLSQLGTLARLDQNGWMTTSDLARAEAMKPQSMGTILATLENHRLIQRRAHPTDRRPRMTRPISCLTYIRSRMTTR